MKKPAQAGQGLMFGSRFLESFAGPRLLSEPRFAIAELIANSWDAGATRVEITWPVAQETEALAIADNGIGMTDAEFSHRWRTLAYDRRAQQGALAEFPADIPPGLVGSKRPVFGRNGIGRFAAFCFGSTYNITTRKNGSEVRYRVSTGSGNPLELTKQGSRTHTEHGTIISVIPPIRLHGIDAESIRREIGLRFLSDPSFTVLVNGVQVGFGDIPQDQSERIDVIVPGVGTIEVLVFDTQTTDRTVKHHGIAWHVLGRLVGECSWRSFTDQAFIDGRRAAARRYTFIVRADCLAGQEEKDWTSFKDGSAFALANDAVSARIRQYLLDTATGQRKEAFDSAVAAAAPALKHLSPRERRKWETFVSTAQETCPSISPRDLNMLGTLLANLEQASSKYALISKLHELEPHQLDQLHTLLRDWTLDMARVVLDELQVRLRLVGELKTKALIETTKEVQELQPIFERGLWIFGPEFETIHFSSNQTMTTVIQDVFGSDVEASRRRPDFVVLTDGSVGLYAYPQYDRDGGEMGIDKVVIVELKRAGVPIGANEKGQCWNYVKELYEHGILDARSRVHCFILGSKLDPQELEPRTEKGGHVIIAPMHYESVLARANSRLLKLYERVKNAPFMSEQGATSTCQSSEAAIAQGNLFAGNSM